MVHVPVRVHNLGTIAPELAPRWTDKRHTGVGHLVVLTDLWDEVTMARAMREMREEAEKKVSG